MTSLELAKKAAAFLDNKKAERVHVIAVSYTHLTLPTIA